MNNLACVRGILKGATALTDSQLNDIIKDVRAKKRQAVKANNGVQGPQIAAEIAARNAERLRIEAAKQRANAANNAIKQRVMLDQRALYADKKSPNGNIPTWAEAMATGSNKNAPGARESATAKQQGYIGKYTGGLVYDLEKAGLIDYVATRLRDLVNPGAWGKGALDDKITIELHELSKENGQPGKTKSPEAKKIADIIYKWQETARADLNRLGAYIGKIPGYIVSQTHDMVRIGRAGFDAWRAVAERVFGNDRTYENLKLTGDATKDAAIKTEFWRQVHNQLSQGEFFRVGDESGFKGPANLAKKLSQHRTLHPNSAELWIEYNDQFGTSSLMEAVFGGLMRNGKAAGLMEKFGTNPKAQFFNMIEAARDHDLKAGIAIDARLKEGGFTSRLWDVIDGTVDIPARISLAYLGATIRAHQSITKLGASVLASVPDVALSGALIRDDFGDNLFSAAGKNLQMRMAQVTDAGKQREMAMLMHVGIDAIGRDLSSRVTSADASNFKAVQKATNAFFKLNLLGLFTDSGERGLAAIYNTRMALLQDTGFADLPDQLSNIMERHGIGEKEWDVIRKHARHQYDADTPMLVADKLRDMPLKDIDPLIEWPLEAMRTQAQEGLARMQKKAGRLDAKIEKLTETLGQQGELGEAVADLKAFSAFLKDLQARDFEQMQTGFEKPVEKLAAAVQRFTKRDISAMDQHAKKIEALQKKFDETKAGEAGTFVDISETARALDETKAAFQEEVEGLLGGHAEDITKAGKLKDRAGRLQARIAKLTAGLERQGQYAAGIEDLRALSDYVKTLQDTDFRGLVEKHRGEIVGTVSRGVRRFAKEDERIAAQHRKKIKETQDKLKLSKRAEPAVLEKLNEAMTAARETEEIISEWPDVLERSIDRRRELAVQELESKLNTFYTDRVQAGVIRGGAREKAYATQGLQAGTPAGEAWRMIMQFKQYPMAFVQQILGRYAEEDRFWSIPGALGRKMISDPRGVGAKMASLMVMTWAMGYVAMTLKDIAKGRTPRDPQDPRTWTAAFLQGGGAGLYGDYLFTRVNRFGGTIGDAAMGPGFSTAFEGADILLASRDAVLSDLVGEGEDKYPDVKAFNYFKANTPFLGLFYTKAALDYLILYDLQEFLRPGSLRRMERSLRTAQKQEFLLPPSRHRATPFTGR